MTIETLLRILAMRTVAQQAAMYQWRHNTRHNKHSSLHRPRRREDERQETRNQADRNVITAGTRQGQGGYVDACSWPHNTSIPTPSPRPEPRCNFLSLSPQRTAPTRHPPRGPQGIMFFKLILFSYYPLFSYRILLNDPILNVFPVLRSAWHTTSGIDSAICSVVVGEESSPFHVQCLGSTCCSLKITGTDCMALPPLLHLLVIMSKILNI